MTQAGCNSANTFADERLIDSCLAGLDNRVDRF